MRVTGNAKRGQIECRYAEDLRFDGEHLDEVVAVNATVHLEQMNDQSFALIIETPKDRACVMIGTHRAPTTAWVCWQEKTRAAPKAREAKRARRHRAKRKNRKANRMSARSFRDARQQNDKTLTRCDHPRVTRTADQRGDDRNG